MSHASNKQTHTTTIPHEVVGLMIICKCQYRKKKNYNAYRIIHSTSTCKPNSLLVCMRIYIGSPFNPDSQPNDSPLFNPDSQPNDNA
jgi:hypothetical protein